MDQEIIKEAYDGIKLMGRIDAPDDPKAVCVIVHGLAEHYGRYDYLAEKLVAAGYAVVRFDHRGHGRSEGTPIYYADHTEIVKDTDVFVEVAKEEFGGLPLIMIGHSMGGFGAASYGSTFPGKIDFYVLSGAGTRALDATQGLDDSLPDDFYIPNALGDGVCSDPAVVAAYAADPLVGKEISVGLMRALGTGIAWLEANPQLFVDPVIIMHGANDGLINPTASLSFFSEIASTDKSLFVYAGLGHEIFNEFKKDWVIGNAIEWLNDRVTA